MGFLLDQAGRGPSKSDPRSDLSTHALHTARKVTSAAAARLLPQGGRRFYVRLYGVSIIYLCFHIQVTNEGQTEH